MTRQRSDEQRKKQIRAAATRCFVRSGYASTRLLDIAREAGLSKGGVYFHYRAKEHLFHDILDTHLTTLHERWSFEPTLDRPALETLERLMVAHLRTIEDEPDETRLFNLLVTLAAQESIFRDKLEELYGIMQGLYAAVIERGIREGEIAPGNSEVLATMVLATANGLAAHSALSEEGRLPVRPEVVAKQLLVTLGAAPAARTAETA
jgi:AcrR family transcriptional regulator